MLKVRGAPPHNWFNFPLDVHGDAAQTVLATAERLKSHLVRIF